MSRVILFPFDKIEKHSNIVLYGAGSIGIDFKEQIEALNYCNIVSFVDRDSESIKNVGEYRCISISQLCDNTFDYIVIASIAFKEQIFNLLLDTNIEQNKIVVLDDRNILKQDGTTSSPDKTNWNAYYDEAEKSAEAEFNEFILPICNKFNMFNSDSSVLDFACGRGRITNIMKDRVNKMHCCDVSEQAVNYCSGRFKSDKVACISNSKESIPIEDSKLDFIYSWDSMVHFDYESIKVFINEFKRILKKDGHAFIHHSNLKNVYSNDKGNNWYENTHCRSNVSKDEVVMLAVDADLEVVYQECISWGDNKDLDCITIVKKK